MTTPAQRQEMIQSIRALPDRLENAVTDLGEDLLDTPYGEGKWTTRQVVHHLAESHLNGFARLKKILTEDNPHLMPYDQDRWAELADMALPLECSFSMLRGLHERMAVVFESIDDETVWSRTGTHPEEGVISVDWILEAYSGHGHKHIGHIRSVRRSPGC